MKKVLVFLLVLFAQYASGQDCGTVPVSKETFKEIERIASQYYQVTSSSTTYLPVKLNIVRANYSGTANDTYYYSKSKFFFEFQRLNEAFAGTGYQFFLCDTINFIINNELDYLAGSYSYGDSIEIASNNVNNAINLYYVNRSNVGGRSNFPNGDKFYNWMFVRNGVWLNGEVLIHEMGHYFNLYHTFETFVGQENVNGSNCATHGDLVCDTPADRISSGPSYARLDCSYTGTFTDPNGQTYAPQTNNYMSYYGSCLGNFTAGQKQRMIAGHNTRLSLIQAAGNQYNFDYQSNEFSVPYNLRVFEINGQVRVVWDDSLANSQEAYLIERSTSPSSGFKCLASTYVNKTLFFDEDYTPGTTYYYRVKSIHAKGQYSNTFQFMPTSPSYPKPKGYSSGDNGFGSLTFGSNTSNAFFYTSSRSEPYENLISTARNIKAGHDYWFSWNSLETVEQDSFKMWIDYNRNGDFENGEILVKGTGETATDSIMIPSSTQTNFYRMRFRVWEKETTLPSSSFRTQYTESADFTLYIQGTCTGIQETTFSDYRLSGNKVVTRDRYYGFGYPSDTYGPGQEGWIYGNQSVELLPGFETFPEYENFSVEIKNCEE